MASCVTRGRRDAGKGTLVNASESRLVMREPTKLRCRAFALLSPTTRGMKRRTIADTTLPTEPTEMAKLTFLSVFERQSPEEMKKLDKVYAECRGNLPSRRQLSAIARSIGVQQSKIRKWFSKRTLETQQASSMETLSPQSHPSSADANANADAERDVFWTELGQKQDRLDQSIAQMQWELTLMQFQL